MLLAKGGSEMKNSKERAVEKFSPGRSSHPTSRSLEGFNATCAGAGAAAVVTVQAALANPEFGVLPLRASAEQLIAEALEAELRFFRARFDGVRDAQGRELVVRNGFQPARELSTPVGRVAVRIPKLRRRDGGRAVFRSLFIPHYMRRVDQVDMSRQCRYLDALLSRSVSVALESLFNGRVRYVPTPVMEHLRAWWTRHCEQLLTQANPRFPDSNGGREERVPTRK
jgi:hypothetical protein